VPVRGATDWQWKYEGAATHRLTRCGYGRWADVAKLRTNRTFPKVEFGFATTSRWNAVFWHKNEEF
jgi:hypothetical protein